MNYSEINPAWGDRSPVEHLLHGTPEAAGYAPGVSAWGILFSAGRA